MNRKTSGILLSVVLLLFALLLDQTLMANALGNSSLLENLQDSSGVMIAGELWDSFFPPNGGQYYKIWRVFRKKPVDWLNGGMRSLDEYWRAQVPGSLPDSLLKPINPSLNVSNVPSSLTAEPGAWGPYELAAVIPQSIVSSYSDNQNPQYAYSWEDDGALFGMEYWYYVSAYADGVHDLGTSYSGTNNRATSLLETSNINRNGATGFWGRTYPFADLNSLFPKTYEGRAAIGAPFEVVTPSANPRMLASGEVKIGVKPNPYKRMSFWDNRADPFDHRLVFYNLPPQCTITVLDVSGQIVLQVPYTSSGSQGGPFPGIRFQKTVSK